MKNPVVFEDENGVLYYLKNGIYYPLNIVGQRGFTGPRGRQGEQGPAGANENIYNIDGTLTNDRTLNMDGNVLLFVDGTHKSVDFLLRELYMNDGLPGENKVVDWQAQQLYRYPPLGGFLSLDWSQSWLTDLFGSVSLDWVNTILYSNNPLQIQSINYTTRVLTNSSAFDTYNYDINQFYSTNNGLSADMENRALYDSLSGNYSLNWETLNLLGLWKIDNDFEFITNGTGPIIQSPDTTRWRIVVDNAGAVSATPA